jgi:hypothetical protein
MDAAAKGPGRIMTSVQGLKVPKKGWGAVHLVEHLPSKWKALSSNPITAPPTPQKSSQNLRWGGGR